MTDIGQTITVPDEATMSDLEARQDSTQGRFQILSIEPGYARVQFRNYYKKNNKREKDGNGAYKLNEIIRKRVKLL